MVSYEDARDRALRAYGGFNRCTETEGAFIFDDDSYEGEGGIGSTIVISKEDGRMMPFHEGVALDLVFNEIRTFDI